MSLSLNIYVVEKETKALIENKNIKQVFYIYLSDTFLRFKGIAK